MASLFIKVCRKQEQIPESQQALINQLIRESGGPQALCDQGGLFDALKKPFIEQALEAEMDEHFGYRKHAAFGANSGNSRNGSGNKTIFVDHDQLEISPP